ncbi:FAD-dependent oxidoreductase [Candidatus Falkowbacteria bacterium]|nr:FAD-dependent oxidoreductase [Candidatus Falkowbacteria bacterium]
MTKYDVIIIGGACAGLTAGLYASRRALKTLILTKDIGGQAGITDEIENYPGFDAVSGADLMLKFKTQAEKWGTEIRSAEVVGLEKKENNFVVKSADADFEALSVILAFGLARRQLGIPGEKELLGRGVTYCATCDGPLFKNKIVAVVGAGNSAFDAADYLSKICKKVYLIHRSEKFRADAVMIDSVKKRKNVEILTNVEIVQLNGEERLESAVLKFKVPSGVEKIIAMDGLFIEIGFEPKTDFLKGMVALDERGQIIVDHEQKTSAPGIFAAGDITNVPFKQIVISAGDGAKAGLSAARFVQNAKGAEDAPDWTKKIKNNR